MINDIIYYIFAMFMVAAIILLVIIFSYEKVLKAIQNNDETINRNVMPICLTVQVMRRFSKNYPIAGLIYTCTFYYMLFTIPVIFILVILESII
jgi:hypothetical protein